MNIMQLVMTVAGQDRPDLIEELTRTIKECKCQILDSRMTELGAEFAAHLWVDGNWNHIAKLETALEAMAGRQQLQIARLRAKEPPTAVAAAETTVVYGVEVVASGHLDNLHELADFFSQRGIKILDLSSSRYPAPYTGAPLFMARMMVKIPLDLRIVALRDEFLEFCDQQNLDAILEPVKR